MPPDSSYYSPNRRFRLTSGCYGTAFWEGDRQIWQHANESLGGVAISDTGDLIVSLDGDAWTVLTGDGKVLKLHPATPGFSSPLRFLGDPPGTCWRRGDHIYVESSQGVIFRLAGDSWHEVGVTDQPLHELSANQLHTWLQPSTDLDIGFSVEEVRPPNFRNLGPRSQRTLQQAFSQGNGRAALALGLGGYRQAHDQLLKVALGSDGEEAQRALVLLDGEAAASELVPALQHSCTWTLAEVYSRVPCPDAVPGLINRLGSHNVDVRKALKAQTRIDLGADSKAWSAWLAKSPATRWTWRLNEASDDSNVLWLAQTVSHKLPAKLAQIPCLVGVFELGDGFKESVELRHQRLIRTVGRSQQRVLEWDLGSGKPVTTMPTSVPPQFDFCWNSSRRLLYGQAGFSCGVWRGQQQLFSTKNDEAMGISYVAPPGWQGQKVVGDLPEWLKIPLKEPHFSPAGDFVEGESGNGFLRYHLDASGNVSHTQKWNQRGDALNSPATHILQDEALVDLKSGSRQTLPRAGRMEYRFSPDGKTVAGGNPLAIYNLRGVKQAQSNLLATNVAFSADGRWLAATLREQVVVLQLPALKIRRTLPCTGAFEVCLDEAGRYLGVVGQGQARIYDLESGAPDLTGLDPRLFTEVWTGTRLWGGGSRSLTADEFWQRRKRLANTSASPDFNLEWIGSLLAIGVLALTYRLHSLNTASLPQ